MKQYCLLIVFLIVGIRSYAPPNCELYKQDPDCYKACELAMTAIRYKQGSYTSQEYFAQSIKMCPNIAYSFMEKAVPYLKRGHFIEWKKLIDQAVELSPTLYLGYRGWCRLQFLRDYEGAIKDIELLKQNTNGDIGYCQTGDYHLNVALALCYKELGNTDTARKLIEHHIATNPSFTDPYDYYHLGVLEYEEQNYQTAIDHLKKQIEHNDYLGETYYFAAMCNKQLDNLEEYKLNLSKAESYYRAGKFRKDNYTETIDKIYLFDILEEKNNLPL